MQPAASGFQHVNGINLYYEVFGSGPPLVLLHGGGGSIHFDWGQLITRLSYRHQLIGIDLQNHGKSDHRLIPETFEQDAEDVVAMLGALGIQQAAFMGFSNGGTTVMQIARLFPNIATKLIAASVICKRSGMPEVFFEGMQQATIEQMPQALKDNFLQQNPDPEKLQNMFEKDSQRMIHFTEWSDDMIKTIRQPIFFIGGDTDIVKAEHLTALYRLLPQSRLMILPADHGGYIMADRNGVINKTLIDFTTAQVDLFLTN